MVLCNLGNRIIKKGWTKMKKFKKFWRVTTRCLLIVGTIVAMLIVSFNVVGKVAVTQFQLGMIYSDIESAESARDYAAEQTQLYKGEAASYYQSQADGWDEEIERLTEDRYAIMHSDDPIVAWAAKDGFEHSIFWPSLLVMIVVVGIWWLVFRNLTAIIDAEELVFNAVMYVIFKTLFCIFTFMAKICKNFAAINRRKKTKRVNKRTANTQQRRPQNDNIVKFDSKRRLG